MVGARDAIAEWARVTYGWIGRSPDYKAAFLATLGANPDFYAPFEEQRPTAGTKRSRRRSPSSTTPSSIRRSIATSRSTRCKDVYMHVEKETDGGLIVSGAKVVATTSSLTH